MKRIVHTALALALSITSTVLALDTDNTPTAQTSAVTANKYGTKLGMGFTGGATTGIGFAFRKHLPNRFGFHFGAFILGGKEGENDEEDMRGRYPLDTMMQEESWMWANIGGELLYTLHRQRDGYFRFYLLAGGEVIFNGNSSYEVITDYDPGTGNWTETKSEETKWYWDNTYMVGAGLGMEFLILKHVGFSIELPLSVMFHGGGFDMYPIGNTSLVYFF